MMWLLLGESVGELSCFNFNKFFVLMRLLVDCVERMLSSRLMKMMFVNRSGICVVVGWWWLG